MNDKDSSEPKHDGKDQYKRLASTPTINSLLRKKRMEDRFSATVDSLDLALSSCYDQCNHWWASRSQVVMQNNFQSPCPHSRQADPQINLSLQGTTDPQTIQREAYKNDLNHVQIGLTTNHMSSTNRGYGRSIDGVFFTS